MGLCRYRGEGLFFFFWVLREVGKGGSLSLKICIITA